MSRLSAAAFEMSTSPSQPHDLHVAPALDAHGRELRHQVCDPIRRRMKISVPSSPRSIAHVLHQRVDQLEPAAAMTAREARATMP